MPRRFKRREPVAAGVRRMADRLIGSALSHLVTAERGEPAEVEAAIHEARTDLKQLRALLRLVRPTVGEAVYRRENATFRDAGRELAGARDAVVLSETLDRIAASSGVACDGLRRAFARRARSAQRRARRQQVDEAREALEAARKRIADWPLDDAGEFDLLAPGLGKTYRQGRRRLAEAMDQRTPEAFHEWRKRVKDLFYQTGFLRKSRPGKLGALREDLKALGDRLGEAHDLAVLRAALAENDRPPSSPVPPALLGAIDTRRRQLEDEALALGETLYRRSPGRFVERCATWWGKWRG